MDALLTVDAACYEAVLESTGETYRELLHQSLTLLHAKAQRIDALDAQVQALKDELQRITRANVA